MKSKNTKRSIWERMKTSFGWIEIKLFSLGFNIPDKVGFITILDIDCEKFNRALLHLRYSHRYGWEIELLFKRVK